MFLHPIVVHFPIALLTLYAIFELVRFKKVLEKPYWWNVKKVFVIAGWLGAILAAITGGIASGWAIQGPRLFVMHEIFALLTVGLSTISALSYIYNKQNNKALIFVALLILASITITGGLGGAMVYGTNFDPFMAPIFKLLGVY